MCLCVYVCVCVCVCVYVCKSGSKKGKNFHMSLVCNSSKKNFSVAVLFFLK